MTINKNNSDNNDKTDNSDKIDNSDNEIDSKRDDEEFLKMEEDFKNVKGGTDIIQIGGLFDNTKSHFLIDYKTEYDLKTHK